MRRGVVRFRYVAWTRHRARGQAAGILHAMGVLAGGGRATGREAAAVPLVEWPPAGTTPLDMSKSLRSTKCRRMDHGPEQFRLTGIWRLSKTRNLCGGGCARRGGIWRREYGIHPALFDAALHAFATEGFAADDEGGVLLPFALSDVTLRAHRGQRVAVRLDLSTSEGSEQVWASMVLWDRTISHDGG